MEYPVIQNYSNKEKEDFCLLIKINKHLLFVKNIIF